MPRRARQPGERIEEMLLAPSRLQAVYVAVRLGIPDLVKNGPRSSTLLASTAGVHPGALHRLLRFLASEGVFELTADGRFAATPLSALLLNGAPGGYHDAITAAATWGWEVWGELLYSVETGRPAFDRVNGVNYMEEPARDPAATDALDAVLAKGAADAGRALSEHVHAGARVVDVGCGSGALLAEVLRRVPGATGVAFDRAHARERARERLEEFGERVAYVEGDFAQSIPAQGDYYVLSKVLHEWDDETVLAILRNCHAAMAPGARLAVLERLLGDDDLGHPAAAQADIAMLVMTGGGERTQAEYGRSWSAPGYGSTGLRP